jgi:aspartate kinase
LLIVKKFGGSSQAGKERVFNVANRILEDYKKGHKVVVVLSAQGDTTDELLSKASEINENPSKRELDMLVTTGEQQACALMAMALQSLGYPAVSLNAYQAGMYTTSHYGNSRLKKIDSERIMAELERSNIVLVTGFQGINRYDDYTTLGRGGSDTTAVALAAALSADKCEIFTDVDGVYTADPRVVKNAKKLEEITYDEMLELASLGAKVLHNRSVEMAKKYGVELVVRSSLTMAEGTIVKEECKMEKMLVSGVAADKNTARIAVLGIKDEPGKAFKLFSLLAKKNINVDIILQSIGRDGKKDISFTVPQSDLQDAMKVLEANKEAISATSIEYDEKVAKVSLVGAGMASNAGVASMMFEALYDAGINIKMISTSEIKISVLINIADVEEAMNAIHEEFKLADK